MSPCRGYLQRPFYIFLAFYVAKIDLKITLCTGKLFTGIYNGWLNRILICKKINYLVNMTYPVYLKMVYHRGFPRIFPGQNKPFEIFLTCLYRNRQCSFNGSYGAVQANLPHNYIVV